MKILDLNNLYLQQVKRLNEISNEIKEDFNHLTKQILDNNGNEVIWLLHPITSRNPYHSDLFINLCLILLTKELLVTENKDSIELIITKNKSQKRIIRDYCDNNKIKIKIKTRHFNFSFFKLIKAFIRLLINTNDLVISKNSGRTKNIKSASNVILFDTFILSDSIKEGVYCDRYYPGLLNRLEEIERKDIFWFSTILGDYDRNQIEKIYSNSLEQIIYKQDFFTIYDYIITIKELLFIKNSKNKYLFKGFDITAFIKHEYLFKRFDISIFHGLLNYRFTKRLFDNNIKLSLVVDWNENQSIDKGLIKGIKTYFPNVKVKGYQGYIISTDFNSYIQPTDFEIVNKVIPDEICVVGKALEHNIKRYSTNLKVTTAPAFRFQSVYKEYNVQFSSIKKILVSLPIGITESYDIITLLTKVITKSMYDNVLFNIKAHPILKIETLKDKLKTLWLDRYNIVEGDFSEIVSQSDVVIGSTSTTLLESIVRGIPVIVIGSQNGLTQNPIPSDIKEDIWTLCYTVDELIKSIDYFLSNTLINKVRYKKVGENIRSQYFEQITTDGVKKFLR